MINLIIWEFLIVPDHFGEKKYTGVIWFHETVASDMAIKLQGREMT